LQCSFVVGVGACAGGFDALKAFLDAMPSDSGMAFVVVTHQQPELPNILPELLAQRTRLPVARATDQLRLEPNHVYVSVPGHHLALSDGTLQLIRPAEAAGLQLPVDHFFRSLAHDQADRAICVVLSGNGSDGTHGLRAIKEHGGMAIVQDVTSAHYAEMPHSAAQTFLADYVLRPEQIPARLLAHVQASREHAALVDASDVSLGEALPQIFALLRNRTGHDFTGYRRSTLERRIERRMRVHDVHEIVEYVSLLRTTPHELDLLFQELLITVTRFFRDPEAVAALGRELATRLAQQPAARMRVWVPGCATGEEAYSLAILLHELAENLGQRIDFRIFGTDLSPPAIEVARAGRYSASIAADVNEARLQRYFTADDQGYRVIQSLRDCVVFSTHNILSQPPLGKLDLVSCRNLLIYLDPPVQRQLFSMFHFALEARGVLWLGTSETVAGHPDLFTAIDPHSKIYQRFESADRLLRLPQALRTLSSAVPTELPPRATPAPHDVSLIKDGASRPLSDMARSIERLLLERFAPVSLIVNERGDIAYFHGEIGRLLASNASEAGHNLFALTGTRLRTCLRAALRCAASESAEIIRPNMPVETRDGLEHLTVIVQRIEEPESLRGLFRVSLVSPRYARTASVPMGPGWAMPMDEEPRPLETHVARQALRGVTQKLKQAQERLAATQSALAIAGEELHALADEVIVHERELASLREELRCASSERQASFHELTLLNSELESTLTNTGSAMLFLDDQLRTRRYIHSSRGPLPSIHVDLGRPFTDIARQLHCSALIDRARQAQDTGLAHETKIEAFQGLWLRVLMLPRKSPRGVIDGLTILFVVLDR
jgi:two-component system CheB/CheR fusion protein